MLTVCKPLIFLNFSKPYNYTRTSSEIPCLARIPALRRAFLAGHGILRFQPRPVPLGSRLVGRPAGGFSIWRLHLFWQHLTKRKDFLSEVLSFWVSAAFGRLHPSGFQCSGSAKPPLRKSRPVVGNLRATRRAAQKGRLSVLLQRSCQSKISILTVTSGSSRARFACSPLPNRTRCRWAPVWVLRCAVVLSYYEEIDFGQPFQPYSRFYISLCPLPPKLPL